MSDKYITLDNLSTFKGKLDDEFNKKQDVITRNQGTISSVLGLDNSDDVVDGLITSSLISSGSATSGKVLTANGSGGTSWESLPASGMSNPMTSVGDLIVGSDSTGTPTRLAKGSNGQVLGINNGSVAWVNEAIPSEISYLTTAPSSANTSGNLKFVVLSSDPSQKYSGYIYIITGSN